MLTSVTVHRVREIVLTDETVDEAGEPDKVAAVIRAVKEASRARATR